MKPSIRINKGRFPFRPSSQQSSFRLVIELKWRVLVVTDGVSKLEGTYLGRWGGRLRRGDVIVAVTNPTNQLTNWISVTTVLLEEGRRVNLEMSFLSLSRHASGDWGNLRQERCCGQPCQLLSLHWHELTRRG